MESRCVERCKDDSFRQAQAFDARCSESLKFVNTSRDMDHSTIFEGVQIKLQTMPRHTKEKYLQWAFVEHDFELHLVDIHIMGGTEVCPSDVGVPLRRSSKEIVAAWLSDMLLSMQHEAPRRLSHPTDLQCIIQKFFGCKPTSRILT